MEKTRCRLSLSVQVTGITTFAVPDVAIIVPV